MKSCSRQRLEAEKRQQQESVKPAETTGCPQAQKGCLKDSRQHDLQPRPLTKDGNTRLMSRDEIMEIIDAMRAEGATYDQVAKRLIDLGQPTFSGRGEWHAQTIHRLCSRK